MDFMSNQLEGFEDWISFSERVILQTIELKTIANWVKYLEKWTGLLSLNTSKQNMCEAAPAPAWNSDEFLFLIFVFDFSFAGNSSPLTWHFLEVADPT